MGKLIDKNDRSFVVEDGSSIRDVCENELSIPFGCQSGICGTCMIDVLEGEENLSELTEQEIDLARDEKHRLACQCKLKHGEVKIDW